MSPKKAPMLQKMTECHSILIFINRIEKDAVTMPKYKKYPVKKSTLYLLYNYIVRVTFLHLELVMLLQFLSVSMGKKNCGIA